MDPCRERSGHATEEKNSASTCVDELAFFRIRKTIAHMRNRRTMIAAALLAIAGGAASCNRYYTPSTDFDFAKGASDCSALCKSWNMQMFGLVAMHDSNTGCICREVAGLAPDGGR